MKSSAAAILYVDDDPDDQYLFLEALKEIRPNIHCYLASDGEKALAVLREVATPLCIYLDLNMPRMNGMETLKAIKTDSKLSDVPVFILTTAKSTVIEKEARESGAVDYLVKPATHNEFVKLLDKCFTAHFG
jgi:CheY-like chemotaxis protein